MSFEKWFDITHEYVYAYDNEGNIVKTIDKENFKEYNYIYDEGKLIRAVEYDVTIENDVVTSKTKVVSIVYVYNEEGEFVKKKAAYPDGAVTGNTPSMYTVNGKEINGSEFFITPSIEEEVIPFVSVVTTTDTDELGRKTSDSVGKTANGIVRSFTYVEGKTPTELGGYTSAMLGENGVDLTQDKYKPTTQLVKDITVKDDESTLHTFSYEYDEEERIKKLVETYTVNGEIVTDTTEYEYDALGQLLTEKKNDTVINSMTYDGYGNILTKNGNTYGYINAAWDDLLTHYNGQQITYDKQGNPTTYRGKSLVWEKGRQLRSYDGITYTYNANGIRTSKKIDNVKHTYILDGTKVLKETWGENTLIPLYDNEDNVCGICYNGKSYYFVKNLQGDVVSLVTKEEVNGEIVYTVVANYTYDAWGVCTVTDAEGNENTTSSFIGNINPYRYRSYYYDSETGLYYLQSRYYDAEVGRFINGDAPNLVTVFAQGLVYTNLYSYCNNNPINNRDTSGYLEILTAMAIGALFGLLIQWIIDIITNLFENKKNIFKRRASYWDYFTAGLSGAVAATGIGKMAAVFYSSITSLLTSLVNNNGINLFDLVLSVALGAICGLIGGKGAKLKDVSGVVSVSKKVLKTVISPARKEMYVSKIKSAAISTIKSAIRYVGSAVASSLGGGAKKLLQGVFG